MVKTALVLVSSSHPVRGSVFISLLLLIVVLYGLGWTTNTIHCMKIKTEDVIAKNVLTEKDINLLKNRANNGEVIEFDLDNREYEITQEQTEKGLAWLNNLRKTPTGKARKNNPFGYREEEALDTFVCFKFDGFADIGNQFRSFYVPIYTVCGKDVSFTYHIQAGGINIIG